MSVHVRLNIVNLKDPDNFQIHFFSDIQQPHPADETSESQQTT